MQPFYINNKDAVRSCYNGFSSILTINTYSSHIHQIILKSTKKTINIIDNEKKYVQNDIYEINARNIFSITARARVCVCVCVISLHSMYVILKITCTNFNS